MKFTYEETFKNITMNYTVDGGEPSLIVMVIDEYDGKLLTALQTEKAVTEFLADAQHLSSSIILSTTVRATDFFKTNNNE